MNETNWRILGLFGAVLFVSLVVVFLATQSRDSRERQKIPEGERTIAHQLAISNSGKYVPEDHETVKKFDELLTILKEETSSSKEDIMDLSIEAVTELEENYNVRVKLLNFMKEASDMASEVDQKISYEEIIAKVKVILSQEKTEA